MSDKMKEGERLNTIIGQGTVIRGECSVSGTVRIDGMVDGSLRATGVAIMGKSGKVKGDLIAVSAIVGGVVEGSVMAQGRLELQSGARVDGDIKAKKLVVEEGVFFQGFCNMEEKRGKGKGKGKGKNAPRFAIEDNAGSRAGKDQVVNKVEEAGKGEDNEEITFHGKPI